LIFLFIYFVLSPAAEKWASGSASRARPGSSTEAAAQPLQGFGSWRGGEQTQVECSSAAPAERRAVRSLPSPNVEQKAAA